MLAPIHHVPVVSETDVAVLNVFNPSEIVVCAALLAKVSAG
jgi:hypothetical protein